jgi:hypothetical protein
MPIHVNKTAVTTDFDKVLNVYISDGTAFSQCKEAYLYNGDPSKGPTGWQPLLFEAAIDGPFTTTGTQIVPVGAFRVRVDMSGASGGSGGNDSASIAEPGGDGATLSATFDVVPFTTLSFTIGTVGGDGIDSASGAAGGAGGSGHNAGGSGGAAGGVGTSGGGGGGGGSSSVSLPSSTVVMIAGAGSGGGGRGNRRHLSVADITGKDSTEIDFDDSLLLGTAGDNGIPCPCSDGAGSGGGGGGLVSGDGGAYFFAGGVCQITPGCVGTGYDNDAFPGEAGTSYYDEDLIDDAPIQSTNTGGGSITFTWLKAIGF